MRKQLMVSTKTLLVDIAFYIREALCIILELRINT